MSGRFSGRTCTDSMLLPASWEVLRILVEKKGISVDSATKYESHFQKTAKTTVLHAFAKCRSLEWCHLHQALPFLLNKDANTELRDGHGMTPLLLCLQRIGRPLSGKPFFKKEMARLLLAADANPNAIDDRDRS